MRNFKFIYAILCTLLIICASCGRKEGGVNKNIPMAPENEAATEIANHVDNDSTLTANGKNLPTVIDFYATWCGPCNAIRPVFEDLEKEYSSSVRFVSVNVDHEQELANKYGVESIPTFVFLDSEGHEVGRQVGADPDALRNTVKSMAAK